MRKLIPCLFILLTQAVYAQNRNEFWSKLNITKKVSDKWALGADFQYRTQSNYHLHQANLFQYSLTYSARGWIYYKLPKSVTLIYSPIAYFKNITLTDSTGNWASTSELRMAAGITKSFSTAILNSRNRLLYETRFFKLSNIQHRYRLQNVLIIPIVEIKDTSRINTFLSNEIFFATQSGVTGFDQDRIVAAVQYKSKKLEVTAGFQFTIQGTGNERIYRNQVLAAISFDI